jgi:hypothetical protein
MRRTRSASVASGWVDVAAGGVARQNRADDMYAKSCQRWCLTPGHVAGRAKLVSLAGRQGFNSHCEQSVADIVQCGLSSRNILRRGVLDEGTSGRSRKLLILLGLQGWLAALDDFRNWLIQEAA